jgi:hypothetical protein
LTRPVELLSWGSGWGRHRHSASAGNDQRAKAPRPRAPPPQRWRGARQIARSFAMVWHAYGPSLPTLPTPLSTHPPSPYSLMMRSLISSQQHSSLSSQRRCNDTDYSIPARIEDNTTLLALCLAHCRNWKMLVRCWQAGACTLR